MTNTLGFEFGQSERLTIRLKGLIRSYPRGVGILKEFVQNADDATATRLIVVMDWRQHAGERLPDARLRRVMGPALLLANNRRFSEPDLQAIRHIGESSKLTSGPKTGRFGLGFNTSYNVTDYPSFLTNGAIYCFDPHRNAAAVAPGYGMGWKLAELWESAPDWPAVFEAAGLKSRAVDHDGTIFRLPTRTTAQASESEICDEAYVPDDFNRLVAQAAAHGTELLLFTKHLVELTIDEIGEDGRRRRRLAIRTINVEEVEAARAEIRGSIQGDLADRLEAWRTSKGSLPFQFYKHRFEVLGDESRQEAWAVVNGFARGDKDRLLDAAREMMRHGEKALPWVGAAARIDEASKTVRQIEGQLYCGLPLSVPVKLPIHLNGYFDLDSSRQKLTVDTGGGDVAAALQARVQWNEALIEQGASWAWSRLLRGLADEYPESMYGAWPDPTVLDTALLQRLASAVYRTTARWTLIRVRRGDSLSSIAPQDLKLPPYNWRTELFDPLTADGLPLPEPALPPHIEQGYQGAIGVFTPAVLRDRLRVDTDLSVELTAAPRPCLRRRDWVESLLRYCLSDEKKDLARLPLAILCDGKLHAFGFQTLLIATADEREIFKKFPHWFVEPDFQRVTELVPIQGSKLVRMRPELVVANLERVLSTTGPRDWPSNETELPNKPWLIRVLNYLTEAKLEPASLEQLKRLPLVPGSDGRLHYPAQPGTPFLPTEDEAQEAMLKVLGTAGVPIVDSAVLEPCRRFAVAKAGLIPALSGPALVLGLHERRAQLSALTKESAAVLLDFLSEARWTYKDTVLRKLRELPILPISTTLVAATDAHVYVPSDFKPPAIDLKISILASSDRWLPLYQRMQIPSLDAIRYLGDALLPALPSLAETDRVRALRWIRDTQLSRLLNPEEKGLRDRLGSVVAVQASDGLTHAINELYDPKSELVRDVLGDAALHPNQEVYRDRPDHWLRFFRELGMADNPRPSEIIQHLRRLITRGLAAQKEIRRVFEFLEKNWKELSQVQMQSGRATVLLPQLLAELPFFPALQESPQPGFRAPEPRLYRSEELALDVELVGSQLPVSAWSIPAGIAKDLKFRRVPELPAVLLHFQRLLDLWESPEQSGIGPDAMRDSLSDIYRHLGRYQETLPRDGDATFVLTSRDRQLLSQLQARRCIWDQSKKRLWLPTHVFAAPVPCFEPRRVSIDPIPKGSTNHALDLLGRRKEPGAEDYIAFLSELQEHVLAAGCPLTEEERKQVLFALQRLADDEEAEVPTDLPLLTRDGGLVPSHELLQDDAPWLRERLQGIRIVASEVPSALLALLEVEALSACVQERLVEGSREPIEQTALDACRQLSLRLRTSEFLSGLRRLVRHHHGSDEEPDLNTIQHLRIQPVASLITEVVLSDGRSLGRAAEKHFFDAKENALFVTGISKLRIVPFLARTISRLLDQLALPDLAPLEHILGCDAVDEIADCLDEDRIKEVVFEQHLVEWDQSEAVQQTEESSALMDQQAASDNTQSVTEDNEADVSPAIPSGGHGSSSPWIPPPASSRASMHGSTAFGGRMEQLIRELLDAPVRKGPEEPWTAATEQGPPAEPGFGRSLVERGGSGGDLLRTDPSGAPDEWTEEERQNAEAVENAAIEYVLDFESKAERVPQRVPRDYPGYDIRSQGELPEDIRYIQVKGLSRDWRDRPVELTPAQMETALRFRQQSWLYVVERIDGGPRSHRICDVAGKIGRFRIDASWARHAEGAPVQAEPTAGCRIFEGDTLLGTIETVRIAGALRRITILGADGNKTSISYKPGVHRLESPDGDTST